MTRVFLLFPLILAACGGAEDRTSFAASSPASTAAPDGLRVPVATVLASADPGAAERSPLLAAPEAAPTADPHAHHHHHHHHHGPAPEATAAPTASPMAMPTAAPSAPAPMPGHDHHQHGAGGAKP